MSFDTNSQKPVPFSWTIIPASEAGAGTLVVEVIIKAVDGVHSAIANEHFDTPDDLQGAWEEALTTTNSVFTGQGFIWPA